MSHVKCLLATIATLLITLEASANFLLQHASPTYARLTQQYRQAIQATPAAPGRPATVLIVGNSLLLDGIEIDRLRSMTASRMRVYPVFLEATGYYDWQYGLRRLFRQGARPDVVVLGVGVNYFVSSGIRQDYAPKLLFDARDVIAVSSDLNLDRTATSGLLLAHVSSFWNTRGAIRTQALDRLIPGLQDLFSLANPRPSIPNDVDFESVSIPRLKSLRQLCADHGAKLILLLPPTMYSEKTIARMAGTAQKAGIEVSIPVDPSVLTSEYFQPDGMHLNSLGASLFTHSLAGDLPERVAGSRTLPASSKGPEEPQPHQPGVFANLSPGRHHRSEF